jgi:hypothetical protein
MNALTVAQAASETPDLISLNLFAIQSGISAVTLWRWRRAGLIKTVNIYGRQYLSRQEIQSFLKRAEAGEFSRQHKAPVPPRGKTLPQG